MSDNKGLDWNWALSRSAIAMVLAGLAMLPIAGINSIPKFYLRTQDLPVILAIASVMGLLIWRQPGWKLPEKLPSTRTIWIVALVLIPLLWVGTHLIMLDYPLTRDEHMVVFDGANFAAGRLGFALPEEWTGFGEPLVPNFLITADGWKAMASAYLPINAMMRTGFGTFADPALMNPILVAVGLVVLWGLARRIFPDNNRAVWIVMLTYLLSAQVMTNAMTNYAMTGHLVFNIIWLSLFLRGGALGHAGAILVGFFALGLHQPVFHPLFAGPILLGLLWQRRFGLFATYAVIYAAALLFWFSYPVLVVDSLGLERAASGSAAGAGGFFAERVLPLLRIDEIMIPLMLVNILRAIAWNAAYLLPLFLIAALGWKKLDALGKQLLAGVLLTIVAIAILLPYQGHGWGYRYIHALLGPLCLLAGYGWKLLPEAQKPAAQGGIIALALVSVLALPFQWWSAHRFIEPHVKLYEVLKTQETDFVLVDSEMPSHAVDDVRNLPDLSNRPLLFSSREMDGAQMAELCERGSIAVVSRADLKTVGLAYNLPDESPEFDAKARVLEGRECVRPVKR